MTASKSVHEAKVDVAEFDVEMDSLLHAPIDNLNGGNKTITNNHAENDGHLKNDHQDIKEECGTPGPVDVCTTSQAVVASVEVSQSDTLMPDAVDETSTTEPTKTLPAENHEVIQTLSNSSTPDRVNRTYKRFVNSKKDPRALAADATPKGKKREGDEDMTTTKRAKTEDLRLPYNTIKAINMPPRTGLGASQVPPEPVRDSFPFGDTEDHHNSMIIHWLDEQEVTYGTAAGLFNQTFPNDKITDEAVRRRHIRSLERLTRRYGAKPVEQIGPVGKNILRRGKARAPRLSGIVLEGNRPATPTTPAQPDAVAVTDPSSSSSSATTPIPAAQPQRALANRFTSSYSTLRAKRKAQKSLDFRKACIVVWKDSSNMDFKTIRDKLENEYTWSLGVGTIEKYYYQNLDRVYGTIGEKAGGNQDGGGEEEFAEAGDGDVVAHSDGRQEVVVASDEGAFVNSEG